MILHYKEMNSPVGVLKLVANDEALVAVLFEGELPRALRLNELRRNEKHPLLLKTKRQLEEYFAGKRVKFDLPLMAEGTQFQKKVWKALAQIPYGETRSYGELAHSVGAAKASRAVGGANGRNPLAIVVPCHRVIGANGTLTGFGGGLERKAILLELEKGAR